MSQRDFERVLPGSIVTPGFLSHTIHAVRIRGERVIYTLCGIRVDLAEAGELVYAPFNCPECRRLLHRWS